MCFCEIYHKESVVYLSNVEAISICIWRIKHVSIANISGILCPTCSSHEIVAVDNVKFVHLFSAFWIKGGLVDVDGSLFELKLRVG